MLGDSSGTAFMELGESKQEIVICTINNSIILVSTMKGKNRLIRAYNCQG